MMKKFTETVLWAASVRNQFQIEGYQTAPQPSCDIIPVPINTPRKREVQLMALLYKNNILNQSLYNISKVPSPMCSYCGLEEETSYHLIFKCSFVDDHLRLCAKTNYKLALNLSYSYEEPDLYVGLLTASRDKSFISSCIDIINRLDFRVTVDL